MKGNIHYKQWPLAMISPCGMGRVSRGNSFTMKVEETTCHRCFSIVISRMWSELGHEVQGDLKKLVMNFMKGRR